MQGVVVSVNESNLINFLPSDSSVFNQSVNSLLRWPTAEDYLRLCRSVSCLEETQLSHHYFFLSISMICFFPFVHSLENLLRPSSTLFRGWATVSVNTPLRLWSASRKQYNIRCCWSKVADVTLPITHTFYCCFFLTDVFVVKVLLLISCLRERSH